jgi:hypothetical protein
MNETSAIPMNPNECPSELDWSAFLLCGRRIEPGGAEH